MKEWNNAQHEEALRRRKEKDFERWKMKHLEEYYYDTATVDPYDGVDAESATTTMQIPTSNDRYRRGEVI